jgi:hypothetical protein
MVKDYSTIAVRKAILSIEDKVTDISNLLNDISMKLCHLIKGRKSYDEVYHDMLEGRDSGI